jgi:hypothetical protein
LNKSKNEKILEFEFICAFTQNNLSFTQMFEFTQKDLVPHVMNFTAVRK